MLKTKILLIIIKTITTSLNLNRAKNVKSFKHGQYLLGIESGKGKKSRVFFFLETIFFLSKKKSRQIIIEPETTFFFTPFTIPRPTRKI